MIKSVFAFGPPAAALALLLVSCSGPVAVRTPIYCAAIAIQDSESRTLLGLLEQFAMSEHLNGTVGVVASAYQDNRQSVELGVTTYLGPVGATIEAYALKPSYDPNVVARLRTYVERDIASRWRVRDCRGVPGLDLPRRIGQ